MACYQVFIRRNSDLKRVQPISKFKRLDIVRQLNKVGSWNLELDFDCTEMKTEYQNEKYGIEVWRNGSPYFTGPITKIRRSKSGEDRTLTLAGTDEKIYLASEYAIPDPWVYSTSYNLPYDSRSGPAERVLKNYVDLNIGPNCPAVYRRVPGLTIEPTQDRGNQVYYVARFKNLLELCQDIILSIPGYNFDIVKENDQLVFKMVPWVNRWKNGGIEFSERVRNLISYDYTYERPDFNFVLVGGGRDTGEPYDPSRDQPNYRVFAYSGNEYSRNRWGTIVSFIDKRGTTDVNELKQAAWDALRLEKGKEMPEQNMIGKINVSAEITEVEGGPKLGEHFDLGDFVRVVIQGGVEVYDYIKEISISLSEDQAESIKATVGSNDNISTRWPFPYISDRFAKLETRLNQIEGGY